MAKKYNIVYPTKRTVDGKIAVSYSNNSSRLSFFLHNKLRTRPRKFDYGHTLGLIEQDTNSNQVLVESIIKTRAAMDKYMSNYLKVDSLSMYRGNNRLGEIKLEYTNL